MDKKQVIAALGSLAHESRLDIFRYLIQKGIEGASAGQIAAKLRLPSATLSFHLSALKQAGMITARRRSRTILYVASYNNMNGVMAYLLENCCSGTPEECAELISMEVVRRRR